MSERLEASNPLDNILPTDIEGFSALVDLALGLRWSCGTSGMKVLVNGGINLSELDGWWAEAYTPEVGWALGDGQEHGDDPELYAPGNNGDGPSRQEMTRVQQLAGAAGLSTYRVRVPATRPVTDYTARVIPHYDGVAVPLEEARIQWQR